MGIVTSMFLITAGAVMRFAVSAHLRGVNLHTAGVVLMVVGVLGAVLSVAFWASWGGFGRGHYRTVVGGPPAVVIAERTVVRERRRP